MHFNKTIQKLAAGILLLLFALSITPRKLLHDVITGHKHSNTVNDGFDHLQQSKSSFQCNWNDQLVESPFTCQPDFTLDHPVIIHSSELNYYTPGNYSAELFLSSLRGPPTTS